MQKIRYSYIFSVTHLYRLQDETEPRFELKIQQLVLILQVIRTNYLKYEWLVLMKYTLRFFVHVPTTTSWSRLLLLEIGVL